ncbi:MAG: hypothetical protein Q4F09_07395 [Erysipelotrichaceae bacterium]|nr:hypothetical protein [Erysipelotrichaceae bacterium]
MRKRNTGINIRVTEPEKKTIAENAKRCNLTVSEYLRKLAMEHEPKELPKKEIYEEMVSLDRKFRRLLSELVPGEDAELQKKYLRELQELRDIMNRIWMLLMANYDTGKSGKKGTAGHGND